jgi:hypothetical protein
VSSITDLEHASTYSGRAICIWKSEISQGGLGKPGITIGGIASSSLECGTSLAGGIHGTLRRADVKAASNSMGKTNGLESISQVDD